MYLVYKPGEGDAQRWLYDPKKLMSVEREMLERRTERNFSEFTTDVLKGNSRCRRALLFMYLKREHPTTRYEDVDFAWGELELEYTRGELLQLREMVSENMTGDQLAGALEQLDAQIAEAYDDTETEGKAELPIAG
ncbi:hypothetical protein NLX86_06695 [Streptomyces sp. A3M-1-3]|uniref:hypothetical protein n=1 Tax=Streptomyces sp. A3M-1-3 TaxID=2962044 RepID=UPI0020B64B1A|nr:hypothetical protein [Streptomyces sp. A3M-1-3]MCP3817835.1 hypothetical protein [Streptomyces sp. A3M-1-3]